MWQLAAALGWHNDLEALITNGTARFEAGKAAASGPGAAEDLGGAEGSADTAAAEDDGAAADGAAGVEYRHNPTKRLSRRGAIKRRKGNEKKPQEVPRLLDLAINATDELPLSQESVRNLQQVLPEADFDKLTQTRHQAHVASAASAAAASASAGAGASAGAAVSVAVADG